MPLSIQLLLQVNGVGKKSIRELTKAGYHSLEDVADATVEDLLSVNGIGQSTAEAILAFIAQAQDEQGDFVRTYAYDDTRKNNPPAGLAAHGNTDGGPATRYSYNPHLPPVLRFDATGQADQLPELLEVARTRKLDAAEAQLLADALRNHQPWLEWTGKREKPWFEVDPVALQIHERVSAEAIVSVSRRLPLQRSLFADPELEYRDAIKFYEHDVEWSNRLILGDSLVAMNSLAKRENLAGKVQMIYIDPPYGIKFASNFQPLVNNRDVRDRDQDLTREPEQVRAYRDTWTLGIHSYLDYLHQRLLVAKDLLNETGSLFVQISDENSHRVRMLLDAVFGSENFIAEIVFSTTSGRGSDFLDGVFDIILWYGKSKGQTKYHEIMTMQDDADFSNYDYLQMDNGSIEKQSATRTGTIGKILVLDNPTSQGVTTTGSGPLPFAGRQYYPTPGRHWSTTTDGMKRLWNANRLRPKGERVFYVRYADDFRARALSNIWLDTQISGYARQSEKIYVVQTAIRTIERCMLMTTDPGDLVLDPTCGSGTTAYVAEQWGRRWITIDTSRVAVALARQRLLTAKFDYYRKEHPDKPLDPETNKFVYKTVPHITLKSIAQNQALDPIFAHWEPILAEKLTELNAALAHVTPEIRTRLQAKLAAKQRQEGKRAVTDADQRRWHLPKDRWEEWEVPFDTDPDWPAPLQQALDAYRTAWRKKMEQVNQTIAASADQEVLVDQPETVNGIVRVTGPFTVEGVQPVEESFATLDTPIASAPEELETFPTDAQDDAVKEEPANIEAYLENMLRLLRQDGIRFPDNQEVKFDRLDSLPDANVQAEGEWTLGATTRRVAISIGPQYGPVTVIQVERALRTAARRGYDDIVFAGFAFDGSAQAVIQEDPDPVVRAHLAHIRPDVNLDGLLKDTKSSQLFTVFGLPRVALTRANTPSDDRFPAALLAVCPNLTIKERLEVLYPSHEGNYYARFDLVPHKLRPLLSQGKVLVTNWHAFLPESPHAEGGTTYRVVNKGPESPEAFAKRILGDLYDQAPIMVFNDEAHHAWRPAPLVDADTIPADLREELEEATVWVSGLDTLNQGAGIRFCVDLSATPFYLQGSGYTEGSPFPWLVSDFSLVDAIESGIVKIPRLPVADDSGSIEPKFYRLWHNITEDLVPAQRVGGPGSKPKPEVIFNKSWAALQTLAGQWQERFTYIQEATDRQDKTPPVMIVVCDNTDIAKHFYEKISGESEEEILVQEKGKTKTETRTVYGQSAVLPEFTNSEHFKPTVRIDSKLLAEAESGDPTKTRDEAAKALRKIVATVGVPGEPGEHVRCVVSVSMLTEGWDANNVTHILGLRAFGSQLLCEQVVGRGLRRMDYTPVPGTDMLTPEYVDIYGVPFSLVPFQGREPAAKTEGDRPQNHVYALEDRAAWEIRFPNVEGYAFALEKNRIRVDFTGIEGLTIDPSEFPTSAFVMPHVTHNVPNGAAPFALEYQDRSAYYNSTHLQAIEFALAQQIVAQLTDANQAANDADPHFKFYSRRQLFPQVLRIVQRYVADHINFRGINPCELGNQAYFDRVVERLRTRIRPDDTQGEPPLLPVLNRYTPIGTSAAVNFKTIKPCVDTRYSHINQVAYDSGWEAGAARTLDSLAHARLIDCYVRNEQMGLAIPYEYEGIDHNYYPDFVLRVAEDLHLILEIKGDKKDIVKAKNEGAARWVDAVTNWGKLGRWLFHENRDPNTLNAELRQLN